MALRHDVPLLNALAVFEVAARHASFTEAAMELNIAQSAVSRHVSNLESYFRLELFSRAGKRIELTPGGKRLADAVGIGLSHIRGVLNELQREKKSEPVTIACSYDIAFLWFMPRFALLRGEMAEHDLRMFASGRYADFDDRSVDLSIRYGRRNDWPDAVCVKLFTEDAFPVCSPEFLEAHPCLLDDLAVQLRAIPLLYSQHRGVQWPDWFARAGVPPPTLQGPVFSTYLAALHEALANRGVILGFAHLLGDLLERGLLVRLGTLSVESDSAMYVVHRASSGSVVQRLASWLANSVDRPGLEPLLMGSRRSN